MVSAELGYYSLGLRLDRNMSPKPHSSRNTGDSQQLIKQRKMSLYILINAWSLVIPVIHMPPLFLPPKEFVLRGSVFQPSVSNKSDYLCCTKL